MWGQMEWGWGVRSVIIIRKNLFLGAGECLGLVFCLLIAEEPDTLIS